MLIKYTFVICQVEEDINLKEKYRSELLKDLKDIENLSYDMSSLLRGLGYEVGFTFPEVSFLSYDKSYSHVIKYFHNIDAQSNPSNYS